jgi:hypothetical protein
VTKQQIIANKAHEFLSRPFFDYIIGMSSITNNQQQTVAALASEIQELRLRLESNEARLKSTEAEIHKLRLKLESNEARLKPTEAENISLLGRVAQLEETLKRPRKNERYYQRLLEERLGAKHHHLSGIGTTDLTTDDAHIEIKKWSDYDDVPGQLAKYEQKLHRARKMACMFGPTPEKARLRFIFELFTKSKIEMYSFDANDELIRHTATPDVDTNPDAEQVRKFVEEDMVQRWGN